MNRIVIIQLVALFGFGFWFLIMQNHIIYSNSLGLISNNWQNQNGVRKLVDEPFTELTNENYIQWDGEHYYQIKQNGYNIDETGGDFIFAFFPLFPLIWKITGLPAVGILFLNYLLFSISILIMLWTFSKKKNYVNNAMISYSLPSLIIFFIPYTEATYMLMLSVAFYGFIKNKYWIYFVGMLLASLTRPSFTFLILSIICTELFYFVSHRKFYLSLKNTIVRIIPLLIGTIIVSLIQLSQNSGSLFKFIEVQKYWQNILSVPHNLRDWSSEGFAINIGVIFLIFVPLLVLIFQLLYNQFVKKKPTIVFDYYNPKDYLLILSIIYLIGNTLFIILFRGGSLHCLYRFTISSPFIFVLLFVAFDYVKHIPMSYRFFTLGILSLLSLFVLGLADYSTYWNFSDFGIFLLISVLSFWFFQDFKSTRLYKVGVTFLFLINLLWTAYLFNTYIVNGWIFA